MSDTNKKLFVDCQVLQHNAWSRGMGRYTLKLLAALDAQGAKLVLLFNTNLDVDSDRLAAVKASCPNASIQYVTLSTNPNIDGGWLELQRRCALELQAQLNATIKPTDTYLIASNFALGYCSVFPKIDCNRALLFYDLTPYLQWRDFGKTPDFEPRKYFAQFETVFEADQLWAISQSAAAEAQSWLGISGSKVENIRGASIRNLDDPERRPAAVADKTKFLLSPSADSPHKNNELMVRAFAAFNAKHENTYKLVITSNFTEQSQLQLKQISSDVIFAGHVTDGELSWLYRHCVSLLFVSKTEGLGLPILEAVSANKKVVCSDIHVFKEISEKAFYFADPSDIESITQALDAALGESAQWPEKQKLYTEIDVKFAWPTVAQTCLELMQAAKVDSPSSVSGVTILYADADGPAPARDIAEIWYASCSTARFIAARPIEYTHKAPSYLVEMGVADHLLAATSDQAYQPVYVLDDSQESGWLLLRALQSPGVLVMNYAKTTTPKRLEKHLQSVFGADMTYTMFSRLLNLAGNTIIYGSVTPRRGTKRFIAEAQTLLETALNTQEKN